MLCIMGKLNGKEHQSYTQTKMWWDGDAHKCNDRIFLLLYDCDWSFFVEKSNENIYQLLMTNEI